MGINISIYGPGSKEHPEWDSGRYAGDRDFAAMLGKELPTIQRGDPLIEDMMYRPADMALWRSVIAAREWPNPGRFERMVDILEANPDYWIYMGW